MQNSISQSFRNSKSTSTFEISVQFFFHVISIFKQVYHSCSNFALYVSRSLISKEGVDLFYKKGWPSYELNPEPLSRRVKGYLKTLETYTLFQIANLSPSQPSQIHSLGLRQPYYQCNCRPPTTHPPRLVVFRSFRATTSWAVKASLSV